MIFQTLWFGTISYLRVEWFSYFFTSYCLDLLLKPTSHFNTGYPNGSDEFIRVMRIIIKGLYPSSTPRPLIKTIVPSQEKNERVVLNHRPIKLIPFSVLYGIIRLFLPGSTFFQRSAVPRDSLCCH